MPSIFPLQTSFAAGELSPRLRGRVDAPVYKQGLATCGNFIPTPQGSLLKRNGLEVVSAAAGVVRAIPFKSTALEWYQVALAAGALSVYTPAGKFAAFTSEKIVNGKCEAAGGGWTFGGATGSYNGTGADQHLKVIGTGYAQQTIIALPADTYTFTFQARAVALTPGVWGTYRIGSTAGGSEIVGTTVIPATDGTDMATFTVTFTLGAPTTVYIRFATSTALAETYVDNVSIRGTAALASSVPWTAAEIPQVQYVAETGRDRMIFVHPTYEPRVLTRLTDGTWQVQTISTAGLVQPSGTPWSGANWPGVVDIWQGRLWFAATPDKRNTFWASKPGTYDFTTGLTARDAFSYDVAMKGEIRWLQGQKVMLCGTDEGEYSISAADGVVYTGNLDIKQESAFGSAQHQALAIGDQVLFLSPDRRKLRAMAFSLEGGGWFSKDITFTAEHITQPTVVDMAFAREPFGTIAMALSDGTLACCNYDRAEQLAGWWTVTPAVGKATLLSVSVMNRPAGDEIWCVAEVPNAVIYGTRYLLRMPLYETDSPKLDIMLPNCAAQKYPNTAGTASYNSANGKITMAGNAIFSICTLNGFYNWQMRIGTTVFRIFSVDSIYIANATVVSGPDITYAATTDWDYVDWFLTVNLGGYVVYPYTDGEMVQVVDVATGTETQALITGGLLISPTQAADTYALGHQFDATAVTLPLEGGNPAGSAQGFKVHRSDIALRLQDSALPTVNGKMVMPARGIGEPLPVQTDRVTTDAVAKNLGHEEGGIVTILQSHSARTEICALYGSTQLSKV